MIIAKVCLSLATIKGHSKICSFTVLGGGGGGSGVTTICLRLLIVACEMLVQSSSKTVRSCWILAGTGTRCRICRPRAPQTCSMFTHISCEYAGQQELRCFQLPGIVYRSLQHGAVHYHAATWDDGRGWKAQQWASGSRHGISVYSKCYQ